MKLCNLEVPAARCATLGDIFNRIGDKWSLMLIGVLAGGPKRFTELKRAVVGISQKVLTSTLRGLERDGFLTRTVTASIPPRVDYELTKLGRELIVPVTAVARFAISRQDVILASRARYDKRQR